MPERERFMRSIIVELLAKRAGSSSADYLFDFNGIIIRVENCHFIAAKPFAQSASKLMLFGTHTIYTDTNHYPTIFIEHLRANLYRLYMPDWIAELYNL